MIRSEEQFGWFHCHGKAREGKKLFHDDGGELGPEWELVKAKLTNKCKEEDQQKQIAFLKFCSGWGGAAQWCSG